MKYTRILWTLTVVAAATLFLASAALAQVHVSEKLSLAGVTVVFAGVFLGAIWS